MLFGAGLHQLRLKSTEVILKSSEAPAKRDFKITSMDLSGVACGDLPQTPIKSIEVKLKSNEAASSRVGLQFHREGLDWSCTRWTSVDSTQGHWVGIGVQRGGSRVELQFHWGGLELELHEEEEEKYIAVKLPRCACSSSFECNSSATPVQCWQGGRQVHRGTSRVGLVLPTSQYCRGVCGGSLSATLMQS